MNIFLKQNPAGHVGPDINNHDIAHRRLESTFNKVAGHVGPEKCKSSGTIIDNLADYSEHMDKTYQINEGKSSDKHK